MAQILCPYSEFCLLCRLCIRLLALRLLPPPVLQPTLSDDFFFPFLKSITHEQLIISERGRVPLAGEQGSMLVPEMKSLLYCGVAFNSIKAVKAKI